MNNDILIEFDGGYLSPLGLEDIHANYISGLNDPEVNRFLEGVRHVTQTKQTVADFIMHNHQASNAVFFGIWMTGAERHCGTVRLHGIEYYHKTAHIGICLFDKSTWGKRIGSKVVKAVTKWAFDTLDLRWIEAGVYGENVASQKTFITAGYEWIYDIPDKYILEGKPVLVKVFAARSSQFQ